MRQPTEIEKFKESLYQESPRGFYELESMKYGLMARLGLDESGALELATKIVASKGRPQHRPVAQIGGDRQFLRDVFSALQVTA